MQTMILENNRAVFSRMREINRFDTYIKKGDTAIEFKRDDEARTIYQFDGERWFSTNTEENIFRSTHWIKMNCRTLKRNNIVVAKRTNINKNWKKYLF